ncbi:TolC family protein [Myxococcota bacterium]|nr:TolC family protein [Myxococcota bacterium]
MIALWLLLPAAWAQQSWDLEAATTRALAVGVDLEAAALAVADRQATLLARRGAALPDLSLRAGSTGSLGRTWSEELAANVTQPVGSVSAGLYGSVPLARGGQIRAQRHQAEAWLEAAQADLDQARHDIAWAVADGLLAVDQAAAQVEIRRAAVTSALALEERIAAYVENGARTAADLHQQRATVASARATLAQAEQSLRDAELGMVRLLRLDPLQAWRFAGPLQAPALPEDPAALVDRALVSRPGLLGLSEQADAAFQGWRSARAGRRPQLDLSVGTSTSLITSNDAAVDEQLADQARAWATVDLTVPLFDGHATRAEVEAATAAQRSAALTLEDQREEVAVHVQQVLAELESARATEQATTEGVAAAEAALAVVEERFAAGIASLVELTDAREALTEARAQGVVARTDRLRAGFTLAWATGALVP